MKMLGISISAAALAVSAFSGQTGFAQDAHGQTASKQSAPTSIRVGVYDSRAVAVAYASSDAFAEELAPLRQEYEAAKAAGDDARVKVIDAAMQARQARFHQMCFGTAPVEDILKQIEDELPAIAKAAGVDVIVSKWAISYSTADANLTDITDQMVAPFHPSERTLKTIEELRQKAPVPSEELEKMTGH